MDILPQNDFTVHTKPKSHTKKIIFSILFLLVIGLGYLFGITAPSNFHSGVVFSVEDGNSLRTVSRHLQESNIIRSRLFFELFVIIYGGEKHLMRADYMFENKLPVYEVARRISVGDRNVDKVSVTIPEGFSNEEIADTFTAKMTKFNKTRFLALAKNKQGYLFPDTYFFFSTDTEVDVYKSITTNYENKMKAILPKILASGKTEREIIIMASLLEKEAFGDTDRNFISGILWHRMAINMRLQADAAPETYDHPGLPLAPIGNPGLEAINAAIYPKTSSYLYYLHDKEGVVHYAGTLSEHDRNIQKYLR